MKSVGIIWTIASGEIDDVLGLVLEEHSDSNISCNIQNNYQNSLAYIV